MAPYIALPPATLPINASNSRRLTLLFVPLMDHRSLWDVHRLRCGAECPPQESAQATIVPKQVSGTLRLTEMAD